MTVDATNKTSLNQKDKPALERQKTQMKLKTKRGKIKADLKSSGLDDLRHKYGKLKSSYQEKDIQEEEEEEGEGREDVTIDGRYQSPALQRSFTGKSLPRSDEDCKE